MKALRKVSTHNSVASATGRPTTSSTHRHTTSAELRSGLMSGGHQPTAEVSFRNSGTQSSSSSSAHGRPTIFTPQRGIANWALQEEKNQRDYKTKVFTTIDQLTTGLRFEDSLIPVPGQPSAQHAQFSQVANYARSDMHGPIGRAMFTSRERTLSPAVARRDVSEMRTASPFLARKEFYVAPDASARSSPHLARVHRGNSFGISH